MLADYYIQTDSWQGVDELLQTLMIIDHMPAGSENMMGQGRGGAGRAGWNECHDHGGTTIDPHRRSGVGDQRFFERIGWKTTAIH